MQFLKDVPDPHRFGGPVLHPDDAFKILRIEEKPTEPKSPFAITGLYSYDATVFDYIGRLQPSDRGELEITDVTNFYLNDGRLRWAELDGFWSDASTFQSLYRTTRYWAEKKHGKANADRVAAGLLEE